jgi:hypothetical protein
MGEHMIRDFLAAHEDEFRALYGMKPARYSGKDAKHAKDLIEDYGYDGAVVMLRRFFRSRDKWIAGCGHGLGVLAASTVQNKLIAEASTAPEERRQAGIQALKTFREDMQRKREQAS